MGNPIQYHNTDNKRLSVKMNGFNSKVVCKNSSVTIWEILFNITIPITRGGFVKRLQYAPPGRTERGVNENLTPVRILLECILVKN